MFVVYWKDKRNDDGFWVPNLEEALRRISMIREYHPPESKIEIKLFKIGEEIPIKVSIKTIKEERVKVKAKAATMD